MLYHVRHLVDVGFLEQAPVRSGDSGALEKPYRTATDTWGLSVPPATTEPEGALAPIQAFQDELREAGSNSVQTYARFMLHLSPDDIAELDRRICAVLDEYVETEESRRDQPVYRGIFVLHRLADED